MSPNRPVSCGWKTAGTVRRLARAVAVAAAGLCLVAPGLVQAENECGHPYYWDPLEGYTPEDNNCFGAGGFRCYKGEAGHPTSGWRARPAIRIPRPAPCTCACRSSSRA